MPQLTLLVLGTTTGAGTPLKQGVDNVKLCDGDAGSRPKLTLRGHLTPLPLCAGAALSENLLLCLSHCAMPSQLRPLAATAFSLAHSRPRRKAASSNSVEGRPGEEVDDTSEVALLAPSSEQRDETRGADPEVGGEGHVRVMKQDSHKSKLHMLHRKRFKPATCSHSVSHPSQIHRTLFPTGSISGRGCKSWPFGHSARRRSLLCATLPPAWLLAAATTETAGEAAELEAGVSR